MTLRELQDSKYILITDSQDISATCESIGLRPDESCTITGIIAEVGEGDYITVWLTESPRPYALNVYYHCLTYFRVLEHHYESPV